MADLRELRDRFDHTAGWPLSPETEGSERKEPYLDNGTASLAPARYFDEAFAKREWDRMWRRVWLLAGRESDAAGAGDFFTFEIGSDSIVVVRGDDGILRGFYNVCQHRGNRIVQTERGSASRLKCRYHSWAWDTDGSIAIVTDRETFREEALEGCLNLKQVRCSVWGGFVFICMDEAAPGLHEFLGVVADHLAPYEMQDMVIVKDVQVRWKANWKTALDAFLEAYHVHAVHPEILPLFDDYVQQHDLYPNGMSRMLMQFGKPSPRWPDQKQINAGLEMMLAEVGLEPAEYPADAAGVREAIQSIKMRWMDEVSPGHRLTLNQMTDDWNYYIFPNTTLNIHPEGALVQRFRPCESDPEEMIYDVVVLAHPCDDPEAELPFYMGVEKGTSLTGRERPQRIHCEAGDGGLGAVLEQDGEMIPNVQKGMRSAGFRDGVRLSEQESRIRHYHAELDRYLYD